MDIAAWISSHMPVDLLGVPVKHDEGSHAPIDVLNTKIRASS
jgi:hypothetical protein